MTGGNTWRNVNTSRGAGKCLRSLWSLWKKTLGKMEQGRNGGGPLTGPPYWTCPRDQVWTGAAGAPAFSWGASGFLAGLRSLGHACRPSSQQGKPRWLLQHIPLPDTHPCPPHPSLHHPAAPSPQSSTVELPQTWAGSQRAAACAALHPYMAHRYLGARGLRRLLSLSRALPSHPAP